MKLLCCLQACVWWLVVNVGCGLQKFSALFIEEGSFPGHRAHSLYWLANEHQRPSSSASLAMGLQGCALRFCPGCQESKLMLTEYGFSCWAISPDPQTPKCGKGKVLRVTSSYGFNNHFLQCFIILHKTNGAQEIFIIVCCPGFLLSYNRRQLWNDLLLIKNYHHAFNEARRAR